MRPASITATLVVSAIWTLWMSSGSGAASTFLEGSIWELSGASTEDRWLELHVIEGEGPDAVYHVSMQAKGNAPICVTSVMECSHL
ncbi:MAG TPA: hypothetical protein VNG73_00210 [Gemmatimonadaceae bacterium]|nr:hypothetical protein [Gemmatimonadaceae bacterium]